MADIRNPSSTVAGKQDQARIQKINDFYRVEARITVEYHLSPDDESLSALMAHGYCEMRYRVTGRARHPDELALQLEELAEKVRK